MHLRLIAEVTERFNLLEVRCFEDYATDEWMPL